MTTSSVSNSANQQISNFFADKANCDSPRQILSAIQKKLFLVSKLCQKFYPVSKFFCRRQQHDYSANISSFKLARQRTETISLQADVFLSFFTIHYVLPDLPVLYVRNLW
jgi:hypothetical protein